MLEGFRFAAILSCSLFAGAALYINVAEHPARMECGTALAGTVFGPSYKRAAVMQAALATVASACGAACWLLSNSVLWLLGAALIFLVIPFTFIVIFPTNKQRFQPCRLVRARRPRKCRLPEATDLEMKLNAFKDYYNKHRTHGALRGATPVETPEAKGVSFKSYGGRTHCRGLYQTPIAA